VLLEAFTGAEIENRDYEEEQGRYDERDIRHGMLLAALGRAGYALRLGLLPVQSRTGRLRK
jgi:hypothetical protein